MFVVYEKVFGLDQETWSVEVARFESEVDADEYLQNPYEMRWLYIEEEM